MAKELGVLPINLVGPSPTLMRSCPSVEWNIASSLGPERSQVTAGNVKARSVTSKNMCRVDRYWKELTDEKEKQLDRTVIISNYSGATGQGITGTQIKSGAKSPS
ncbi:unnamed protein product [Calicophoron daubneyi]|uniref:Uncharacterized protein n=1 Tax=Calicophoron daubneyi TaxID=300641 RepID=A0AAV2TF71_CALDB